MKIENPKKSLGQNFLTDKNIIDIIVNKGNINENDVVLEIGPGTGNLTERILPTEVSLSDAYPNPFNPTTMLSYNVSADMMISLSIFDMRGRLVDELVNDVHAQGQYSVTWNADAYSSGVYMVKLVAGNTMQTQKIMLVK